MNFVTTDDGKLDMLTIKTILFGRIELIQFIIPFDAVIDGIDIANGTYSRFNKWPDFMITSQHSSLQNTVITFTFGHSFFTELHSRTLNFLVIILIL